MTDPQLRWNRSAAAVALISGAAAIGSLLCRPRPVLVWNASASSPRGLYAITFSGSARRGEMVVAWAPQWARRIAAERGYLPLAVPLVKPVAAVAGDRVCAAGSRTFVNGRFAAVRRFRDAAGRPMPWWSGCRMLGPGEMFLLSAGVGRAFDGRYFGVTRSGELVGRARLLWSV